MADYLQYVSTKDFPLCEGELLGEWQTIFPAPTLLQQQENLCLAEYHGQRRLLAGPAAWYAADMAEPETTVFSLARGFGIGSPRAVVSGSGAWYNCL